MGRKRRIPALVPTMATLRPDSTPNNRTYSLHGPYSPPGQPEPPIDPVVIAAAAPWADDEARREMCGMLAPFTRKARALLTDLVAGSTLATATARVLLAPNTVSNWRDEHPGFNAAVELAYQLGTLRFEDELHRRALAGTDDRASMRALEMLAKSRNADYRDRAQQDMAIVAAMGSALAAARGWRALPSPAVVEPGP